MRYWDNKRMKQIVILSGKGGTGKTSITAAFAHLAYDGLTPVKAVLADADVDAANLELVLQPGKLEEHEFMGGAVAEIDDNLCSQCGSCEQVCRFEAIHPRQGNDGYFVDPIACDGCAACVYQCPSDAIHMQDQLAGFWYLSDSRYGPLFHAELRPAQENSGKLVTLVKQQARLMGLDTNAEVVIVDGPPGIGCPVISASSGADLALIVAEPSASGVHDMERVLAMTTHFRIPSSVCINKADTYSEGSKQIESYCQDHGIEMLGHIPFDLSVTKAMVYGEPVTVFNPGGPASQAIKQIWQSLITRMNHSVEKG
jgi:MinD superfamily P-loop ATPase